MQVIDAIKLDMGFIRDAFKEGGSTRMSTAANIIL